VYDLAQAMPISALDDFETRMASPAASISRHFKFTERVLLQARATADARARSFQRRSDCLPLDFSFDLQCAPRAQATPNLLKQLDYRSGSSSRLQLPAV
jgi:hypothetical protein